MSRRIDLLGNGNFYKANLHTHTNVSDGVFSPLEVKKMYMEKGYSIVAYTDHEVLVSHKELSDDNFLAITSYELSINERGVESLHPYDKCYHFNCYANNESNEISPVFSLKEVWHEESKQYINKEQFKIEFDLQYNQKTVTDMINKLNEAGFLVCYNHPVWSMSEEKDYSFIDGLWGVEVFNGASYNTGYVDTTTPLDYLLMQNKNVFPIACDDMHVIGDAFLGFTMIKAPSLKYADVFNSLKEGHFYSSEGPLIHELYLEGKILNINCSKCSNIILSTPLRRNVNLRNKDITIAQFDLSYYFDNYKEALDVAGIETYFRITIVDEQGKKAYTKAYFIKDYI